MYHNHIIPADAWSFELALLKFFESRTSRKDLSFQIIVKPKTSLWKQKQTQPPWLQKKGSPSQPIHMFFFWKPMGKEDRRLFSH